MKKPIALLLLCSFSLFLSCHKNNNPSLDSNPIQAGLRYSTYVIGSSGLFITNNAGAI